MSPSAYADDGIVVPAFNEGPMIAAVVKGLRAVFPNVVVDDGSFDV
jgi:glycosyltransferase involved in cell wall biosynthesis